MTNHVKGVPAESRVHVPTASEWRRAWGSLSPETRRRIQRAHRRGEAMEDPHLAALAVGYAERIRASTPRAHGRILHVGPVFIAVLGVLQLLLFVADDGLGVLRLERRARSVVRGDYCDPSAGVSTPPSPPSACGH